MSYKILLDKDWSLEDLSYFCRLYFQNYSFFYCLENTNTSSKIPSILEKYELKSGVSYVNIYNIFKSNIPTKDKPQINQITYASPGFIDLILNSDVAITLAKNITAFIVSSATVAKTYQVLYKIYYDFRKAQRDNQGQIITHDLETIKQINNLNEELSKGIGFSNYEALTSHTNDPEKTSMLLMAQYRRMRSMAVFIEKGKSSFPLPEDTEDN